MGSANERPIAVVGHKWAGKKPFSILVKKSWKCGCLECSAEYNCHILLTFKELMCSVLARAYKRNHFTRCLQEVLHMN